MQSTRQRRSVGVWRALPVIVTAAIAVGCAVVLLVDPGAFGAPARGWIVPAGVAVQAAALTVRHRMPLVAFGASIAVDVLLLAISGGELSVGTFALMVSAYTIRREMPARRAYLWLAAGGVVSALVTAVALTASDYVSAEWRVPFAVLRALLTFGAPAVIAELVLARRGLVVALRERAEMAEREQGRAAAQAVQQERALIARELHDIAAHHLTGIIVSAQAAGSLIELDPERARGYLKTVGDEARITLDNVRRTVGLLRVDDVAALAPVPSIREIPGLVEEYGARGATVGLRVVGTPMVLGPVAEVTAYRMVQESLANVARHAPGAPCDVLLEYAGSEVRVTVTNPAAQSAPPPRAGDSAAGFGDRASGGHGLAGMRERAELVGGTVQSGPMPDGGWRTRLVLPAPDPLPERGAGPAVSQQTAEEGGER